MRIRNIFVSVTILVTLCLPRLSSSLERPQFYLHNGDRVVFYGDSITEQLRYTTYIETYCVTRFPKDHFTFVNSGWGGDRVTGGGGGPIDLRINRDILPYKPTVVTICLGMNDGGYQAFNPNLFRIYVNGYRHIITTLLKQLPGVRITLLTAPAFDDVTRPANFPGGYNSTLTAFNEAVKRLARQYHLTLADTNAPLVAILARSVAADPKQAIKIIPDRVHPSFGGHLIMAAAVLHAWNAPEDVAEVSVNSTTGTISLSKNTHLSNMKVNSQTGEISFTETDDSFPWPIYRDPKTNPNTMLALTNSDVEKDLNNYRLQVTGLKPGSYLLKVDGTPIGQVTGEALQDGIDLATLPTLPTNLQSQKILALAFKHIFIHFKRWRVVQVPHSNGMTIPDNILKQMDALDRQEAQVDVDEHKAVQPAAHFIELIPQV